jgi:hypothetical protein
MFNEGRYLERARAGEFTERIIADRHPSKPKANEPFCTRSQMVSYVSRLGHEVVRFHRYLRTDGTLGASGRPDPKVILYNLVQYIAD